MVTDAQFVELLNACPLSERDLANGLSVSHPTVTRWRAGKNLPHQAMRPAIVDFLRGRMEHSQSGSTVHLVGCDCGFCKLGFTRA